jgi:hypothetical protein
MQLIQDYVPVPANLEISSISNAALAGGVSCSICAANCRRRISNTLEMDAGYCTLPVILVGSPVMASIPFLYYIDEAATAQAKKLLLRECKVVVWDNKRHGNVNFSIIISVKMDTQFDRADNLQYAAWAFRLRSIREFVSRGIRTFR